MRDSEAERPATDRLEADLLAAEQALQAAQRHGDVAALDALLDDRLIAIGPDGGRYTKQDDLDAYRTGSSVVESLVQESLEHLIAGHTGVTFFTGTVSGTFGGAPVTARMRYTRTWAHTGGRWRILAAHITPA
ncbi:nuclear transport factor 2 family protein [Actinoplanes missouriensis]|uniref:nuclear transport factor 2 family protein n=1 Tax=Actinoplanes missouriensis TaxID=1866 RepID=UPI0033E5EA2B